VEAPLVDARLHHVGVAADEHGAEPLEDVALPRVLDDIEARRREDDADPLLPDQRHRPDEEVRVGYGRGHDTAVGEREARRERIGVGRDDAAAMAGHAQRLDGSHRRCDSARRGGA
jgi:hypothetical protein